MFWKKNDQKGAKLHGPKDLPDPVKKQLANDKNIDPDALPFLKMTLKSGENGSKSNDIRIFDPSDAEARGIVVKDYDSLTANTGLIIGDGKYDESTKKAEVTIRKPMSRVKLLNIDEILNQIEAMKEPGSSLFFYMSAGTGSGGPLGRGSSIVKYNNGDSKHKKYAIYGANVIDMKPDKEGQKIFESDKPKEVAKWLAEAQKPRFC
jgi:hypothetical protein